MLKATLQMGAIVIAFLCHSLACAGPIAEVPDGSSNTLLLVEYSQGDVEKGPLLFGLAALPAVVNAEFRLGPVAASPNETGAPGETGTLRYLAGDVLSAAVSFGNARWTALASFELEVENGVVESLSYAFSPTSSSVHTGGIVLNFPLSITGTEISTGAAFSYTYDQSTQTFQNVPAPAPFALLGAGLAALGFSRRASPA